MSDEDRDERKGRPRCTARTANGGRCRNYAEEESTRCGVHGFKVPGRPTKLNPALIGQITALMVEGNYVETAAQACGVSKRVLYNWLSRAEDLEAAALEHVDDAKVDSLGQAIYDHTDPAQWAYLDFLHAFKSAQAFAVTEDLRAVRRAGAGWQARAWMLERRRPTEWGRRDVTKLEVEGELKTRPVKTVAPDTDEKRREVAEVLVEAGAVERPTTSSTGKRKPRKKTPRKDPKK